MKKTLLATLLYAFLFIGCKNDKGITIAENDVITDYHRAYFGKYQHTPQAGNFAIYLDYSDGIKAAFNDDKTLQFYNLFINSLKISTVDFYEVDKQSVNPITNLDKGELYRKVKEPGRFDGINAPLDKAIDQIVANEKEAVFITDGELWDNGERDDPWAREAFGKWLKDGHTIDFYVTDHVEKGKHKHLFYMFFIPSYRANDANNISQQFKYYLDNSVEAKSLPFTRFSFCNSSYRVKQEYADATSGGANTDLEIDRTTYINKGDTDGFEFHEYILSWKGIVEFIREGVDATSGNPIKGGAPVISKLFLETGTLEFYTINELGIEVYDAKADIDKLIHCRLCIAEAPVFETDSQGKKVLDANNEPIVQVPGREDCYNEKGTLTADTSFKTANQLPKAAEIYVLDHDAFINNYKQQGRGELIIKVHPNFNGSQVSEQDYNLHRVDVYLKNVTPNTSNPNLEKFMWDGLQVDKNRSMYNSILGALNEANPQGRVIYTYYIKTLPNDYKP